MAQKELPYFAEKRLRIGRARLAHLWLKSTEAYGNLPGSTDSVIVERVSRSPRRQGRWLEGRGSSVESPPAPLRDSKGTRLPAIFRFCREIGPTGQKLARRSRSGGWGNSKRR